MGRARIIEKTEPDSKGFFLVIKEVCDGLLGEVRDIKKPKEVRMSARFYEEDKDASAYRVKEYFGFSN